MGTMQKKERGDSITSAAATAVASARKALELAVKSLNDQKDRGVQIPRTPYSLKRSGNCGDQQEETYP